MSWTSISMPEIVPFCKCDPVFLSSSSFHHEFSEEICTTNNFFNKKKKSRRRRKKKTKIDSAASSICDFLWMEISQTHCGNGITTANTCSLASDRILMCSTEQLESSPPSQRVPVHLCYVREEPRRMRGQPLKGSKGKAEEFCAREFLHTIQDDDGGQVEEPRRMRGQPPKGPTEEAEDFCTREFLCTIQGNDGEQVLIHSDPKQQWKRLSNSWQDLYTLLALLKTCGQQKDLPRGRKLHADIVGMGLPENNLYLGSALVSMYAKCGSLARAQEVFNKLPVQDVVSWSALITGFAQHGHGEQALNCFQEMQAAGFAPDAVTFVGVLKACGSTEALEKGKEIHAQIVREGLLMRSVIVGNALVDMYTKCGLLAKAQEVLDKLPLRNVASWNALISGYNRHRHGEQALESFHQMQLEGLHPDAVTFVCALKACGIMKAAKRGKEIHSEIVREGFLDKNIIVGNALIDMYMKCGLLARAQDVFDKLPARNLVSWNALIAGYIQHELSEQALKCFDFMKLEGVPPDAITFICVLKACGSIRAAYKGQQIHAEILREGLLEKNIFIGNTLVDMYAKCGLLAKAQEVFDKLPVRDAVSWSVLIAGCTQHGQGEEAIKCFERMDLEGFSSDAATFTSTLKACGSIGASEKGNEIHTKIIREGSMEKDIVVGTALADMYAKCGLLAESEQVVNKLPSRDVVLWSVLIAGYTQHGHGQHALKCLERMQLDGLSPDAVTYACILKACSSLGVINKGKDIHAEIAREGLLEENCIVGSVLVEMYTRSGMLTNAQEVFDRLPARNVVSWSALMTGYALLGNEEYVFSSFENMVGEGIRPDLITFTIVLNACAHAGLMDKGQMYFEIMSKEYGLVPTFEHHSCMVALFARAGHLSKAITVIKEMPFPANITMWLTVLGACKKWRNTKLGKLAFEHVLHLNAKEPAAYVCLSNIYASASSEGDEKKVEESSQRTLLVE